jgi:hypothetical protein
VKAAPHGRTWAIAGAAGVLILLGLAYVVRVPESPAVVTPLLAPSVALVDPVVIRGTMLRDPTPLFLPTEFNSSRQEVVASPPTGAFAGFPAQFAFDGDQLDLKLPPPTVVPASPAEALVGDPLDAPFVGFGRADYIVQPVAKRNAYVEILDAGTGRMVYGGAITDAHPPETSIPWEPMEFLAAVDAAGLVGPLVPTARSGVDEVDSYFGRYLAETLRVGQRLAPGFYRISVGP